MKRELDKIEKALTHDFERTTIVECKRELNKLNKYSQAWEIIKVKKPSFYLIYECDTYQDYLDVVGDMDDRLVEHEFNLFKEILK